MVTENPKSEVLAFVEKFDKFGEGVAAFLVSLKGLRSAVVQLANDEVSIDRRVKAAQDKLRQAEEEASSRLASFTQGSRAIMERVSEKERLADKMRQEFETKIAEVNRQLSDLEDTRKKLDAEYATLSK